VGLRTVKIRVVLRIMIMWVVFRTEDVSCCGNVGCILFTVNMRGVLLTVIMLVVL